MEKIKFIDLFAGIGGFRIAFEQTGYKCVYSCEIDPKCQEVYFNNFLDKPAGDITKIDINSIPAFDVWFFSTYYAKLLVEIFKAFI
ncbi:MAG: DNA cytosine methyltransferase [Coleofasciculus chthonoplastes F3-SA18-01]|uniref:DNA cytosine methyltransferase n=1 Tax=Coleofasciculus chthonoplastes TaxID=64178 RepID=UPI0032F46B6C